MSITRWALVFAPFIFYVSFVNADVMQIDSIDASGPPQNQKCGPNQKTSEPPFLVSKLNKNIDEQKKSKNPQMTAPINNTERVPAMTVVRVYNNPITFSEAKDTDLIRLQVVSVPGEESLNEMKSGLKKLKRAVSGDIALPGDFGHLPKSELQKLDDYVFSVKEDTHIIKFPPEIEAAIKNSVVRFSDSDGNYTIHECCTVNTQTQEKTDCKNSYQFEIVDEANPNNVLATAFDDSNCGLMSLLFPIPKNERSSLVELKNIINQTLTEKGTFTLNQFRFFDDRGFAKIPVVDPVPGSILDGKKGMQYGPAGSMHYVTSSNTKDQNDNNTFAHPTSSCAFFHAVEAYNKECNKPGCVVQWGDWYTSKNLTNAHVGHNSGSCVDVRPMSKVADYDGLNFGSCPPGAKPEDEENLDEDSSINADIKPKTHKGKGVAPKKTRKCYYNPEYSKQMTNEFAIYMKAAGAVGSTGKDGFMLSEPIFFNDTAGIQDVRHLKGHSNHLHMCFPPNEPAVKQTCADGFTMNEKLQNQLKQVKARKDN